MIPPADAYRAYSDHGGATVVAHVVCAGSPSGLTVLLRVHPSSVSVLATWRSRDEVEDLLGAAVEPDLVLVAVLAGHVDGCSPPVGGSRRSGAASAVAVHHRPVRPRRKRTGHGSAHGPRPTVASFLWHAHGAAGSERSWWTREWRAWVISCHHRPSDFRRRRSRADLRADISRSAVLPHRNWFASRPFLPLAPEYGRGFRDVVTPRRGPAAGQALVRRLAGVARGWRGCVRRVRWRWWCRRGGR